MAGQEVSEGEWPPGSYWGGWESEHNTRPPGQAVCGLQLLVSPSRPEPHDHQQGDITLIKTDDLTHNVIMIQISLGTRTLPPPPARATMITGPTSGSSVRMDTRWPSGQTGQWQMMAQWVLIRWSRGNNIHILLWINVLIDLGRIVDCLRGATPLSYYSNFDKTFVNALSYKCLHLDFLELNHQTFQVVCLLQLAPNGGC